MDNTLDKTAPSMLHLLTDSEAAILDAANHVKFGELLDVEVEDGERKVSRRITATQIAFIMTLRSEGLSRLDTIIVHNGSPSQIEIDGKFGTIKYKRKIRFN
jgi:hypothetical protein